MSNVFLIFVRILCVSTFLLLSFCLSCRGLLAEGIDKQYDAKERIEKEYWEGIENISIDFDQALDPTITLEERKKRYRAFKPPSDDVVAWKEWQRVSMLNREVHKAKLSEVLHDALQRRLNEKTRQNLTLLPAGTGTSFEWNDKTLYIVVDIGCRLDELRDAEGKLCAMSIRGYRINNNRLKRQPAPYFRAVAVRLGTIPFVVRGVSYGDSVEYSDQYYEDMSEAAYVSLAKISSILNTVYGE